MLKKGPEKSNPKALLLILCVYLLFPVCAEELAPSGEAKIPEIIVQRTNNINLIFKGYAPRYSPKEQEFIAKKFNAAILREYNCDQEVVANLKKINPKIKIFIYENMYTSAPEPGSEEDIFFKKNHPDWFARDKKGLYIYHKGWPVFPKMDIGKKEWQAYYAKRAHSILNAVGADGLYIDELNSYFNLGDEHTGVPVNYSPENWKRYNKEFLKSVRHELGDKYLIIFNGLAPMPDEFNIDWLDKKIIATDWHGKEYLEFADGAQIEAFISRRTHWDQFWNHFGYSGWDLSVGLLEYSASRGKITSVIARDKDEDRESQLYSLCSFLLIQNKFTYFYYSDNDKKFHWFPEWEANIGEPLGIHYSENGVYQRDFEKAKILVNPGDKKIRIKLPQDYKTLKGKTTSTIKLEPSSGTILLK